MMTFVEEPLTKTFPFNTYKQTNTNSVAFRPSANYTDRAVAACRQILVSIADRRASRGQRDGSPRPLISVFKPEPLLFHSSSSSVILTRAECTPFLTGNKTKQTPWPLVRKRTIPTERPPLVGETLCQLLWIEGCHVVSAADPLRSLIPVF
jgi:hypothetical protein